MGLLIELSSEEKLLNKIRSLFKASINNASDISFDMFCEALCTDNCIQPIFDVHIKQYVHNMDARHSRSTGTTIVHDNLSNTSEQNSRNSERTSNIFSQRAFGRTLPSLTELGFLDSEAHSIFRLRGSSPGPENYPEFPNVQIITDPSLSRRLNDMLSMSLGGNHTSNTRSNIDDNGNTNETNNRAEDVNQTRELGNSPLEQNITDQSGTIFNHLSRQNANGSAINSLSEPVLISLAPTNNSLSYPTNQVSNDSSRATLNNRNSSAENSAALINTFDPSLTFHSINEIEPFTSSFRNAQQASDLRQNGILRSVRNRRNFSSFPQNHGSHPYLSSNRSHTNTGSSVPLNSDNLESNINSSNPSVSRVPDELIDRFFGFSPGSLRF